MLRFAIIALSATTILLARSQPLGPDGEDLQTICSTKAKILTPVCLKLFNIDIKSLQNSLKSFEQGGLQRPQTEINDPFCDFLCTTGVDIQDCDCAGAKTTTVTSTTTTTTTTKSTTQSTTLSTSEITTEEPEVTYPQWYTTTRTTTESTTPPTTQMTTTSTTTTTTTTSLCDYLCDLGQGGALCHCDSKPPAFFKQDDIPEEEHNYVDEDASNMPKIPLLRLPEGPPRP